MKAHPDTPKENTSSLLVKVLMKPFHDKNWKDWSQTEPLPPGCVKRLKFCPAEGEKVDVLLMDDGSVKTSIPEIAEWEGVVSLQVAGQAVFGLRSDGRALFYAAPDWMRSSKHRTEWWALRDGVLRWTDVAEYKVIDAWEGNRLVDDSPYAIGVHTDGTLALACAATLTNHDVLSWLKAKYADRLPEGVEVDAHDMTLKGSGRYAMLNGKKLRSGPLQYEGREYSILVFHLENDEVAVFESGQEGVLHQGVLKVAELKCSRADIRYALLFTDGTLHIMGKAGVRKAPSQLRPASRIVDILSADSSSEHLAVLYKNGDLRLFNIDPEYRGQPINIPIGRQLVTIETTSMYFYSGEVLSRNVVEVGYANGLLLAAVNVEQEAEQKLEEENQAVSEINGSDADAECETEWLRLSRKSAYIKYYNMLLDHLMQQMGKIVESAPVHTPDIASIQSVHRLNTYGGIFFLTSQGRVHYLRGFTGNGILFHHPDQALEDTDARISGYPRSLRQMLSIDDAVALAEGPYNVTILRRNGTLLSYNAYGTENGYDCSQWTGIIRVVQGFDFLAGLRSDGTVLACSLGGISVELDKSEWFDVKTIAVGSGGRVLFGVRGDGSVLQAFPGDEYGGKEEAVNVADLPEIKAIAVGGAGNLFALTKANELLTVPECKHQEVAPLSVVDLWNNGAYVFAKLTNGQTIVLNESTHYQPCWENASTLLMRSGVCFAVLSDGSLKAVLYQKQAHGVEQSEFIRKVHALRNVREVFVLARQVVGDPVAEFYRALFLHNDGTLSAVEDELHALVSGFSNVSDVCVLKKWNVFAFKHGSAATMVLKIKHETTRKAFFKMITYEHVDQVQCIDGEESLLLRFASGRLFAVGDTMFCSDIPREPAMVAEHVNPPKKGESTPNRPDMSWFIGITKDRRPLYFSCHNALPVASILDLVDQTGVTDCAPVLKNTLFLREGGTVYSLKSSELYGTYDYARKHVILASEWYDIRKLYSDGSEPYGIGYDNRAYPGPPDRKSQSVVDMIALSYRGRLNAAGTAHQQHCYVRSHINGKLSTKLNKQNPEIPSLPYPEGTKRLLWVKGQFFALSMDGTLWRSTLSEEDLLSFGEKDRLSCWTPWEKLAEQILDLVGRGDDVYVKVMTDRKREIIDQYLKSAASVADDEMMEYLKVHSFDNIITGNKRRFR